MLTSLGRWDEDGEVEGWFRFAGQVEECYGKLTHTRDHGSSVHLFDCPLEDGLRGPVFPSDRLFVRTLGDESLTVAGLKLGHWSTAGIGNGWVLDLFAEEVIVGSHVESDDLIERRGFVATMYGLDDMLAGGLTDWSWLNPKKELDGRVSSETGEHRTIELTDECRLMLRTGTGLKRTSRHEQVFRTTATMQVDVDAPRDIAELEREYLEPMRELASFCVRRPASVRSLSFFDEEPRNFQIVRRFWPQIPLGQKQPYRLTLNLAQVAEPEEVVARWFALRREVGPVWSLFFSTIDGREQFLENRFLNLMAFCEGYHRAIRDRPPLEAEQAEAAIVAINEALADSPAAKEVFVPRLQHANSQSQRARLLELAEAACSVIDAWSFSPKPATRGMVDTRNWMTHWGSRTSCTRAEPDDLFEFCRQLEVIIYVTIMKDLGLTDDEVAESIGDGWVIGGLP